MSGRTGIQLLTRANRLLANINNKTYVKLEFPAFANNNSRTILGARVLRNFATEKSATTEPAAGQQEPTGGNTNLSDEANKYVAEIEKLTAEVVSEKEKYAELMDKYKRALADSENLRVRLTKQIADAKIFGIQNFCKDLIEVADTLGQATAAVPTDQVNDQNPHLKNLFEGLAMTQASLLQTFKRHGLEMVNPINQKFDPNFHEALFQKEDKNVEPNTVVEVTKFGYKLQERCIRPALVGVSKSS